MASIMSRDQSRFGAGIETALNIGSGFILSWGVWVWVVAPLWDIPFSMADSLGITAIFTLISAARSYLWRRWFNAKVDV